MSEQKTTYSSNVLFIEKMKVEADLAKYHKRVCDLDCQCQCKKITTIKHNREFIVAHIASLEERKKDLEHSIQSLREL